MAAGTAHPVTPELPRGYEPVVLDRVGDVLDEAAARAAAGADEGTLVWAGEQTAAKGRCGQPVIAPPGGLYFGLVLQPDAPRPAAAELATVTAVSLGAALGELLSPMTDLHYGWPNDLRLAEAKAGAVQLRLPAGQATPDWMVVGAYMNVTESPPELGFAASSLGIEGDTEAGPDTLLGVFARQFVSWVNRWAEEGFAPVQRAWSLRVAHAGTDAAAQCAGRQPATWRLDAEGALIIDKHHARPRRVELATAYGLDGGPSEG